MKKLIAIAALASAALTTQAQANAGLHMKNCVIETTTNRVMAETPWLEEMLAYDPTLKHEFIAELLWGFNSEMTDADWEDFAAEDLSWMRVMPTDLIVEDWIIDAFISCSTATPSGS